MAENRNQANVIFANYDIRWNNFIALFWKLRTDLLLHSATCYLTIHHPPFLELPTSPPPSNHFSCHRQIQTTKDLVGLVSATLYPIVWVWSRYSSTIYIRILQRRCLMSASVHEPRRCSLADNGCYHCIAICYHDYSREICVQSGSLIADCIVIYVARMDDLWCPSSVRGGSSSFSLASPATRPGFFSRRQWHYSHTYPLEFL